MEAVTGRDLWSGGSAGLGLNERRAADSYSMREADESIKEDQRRLVSDFLLRWHQEDEYMCVLSLPDVFWTFERILAVRRRRVNFLGLNWSWSDLERGARWMPGTRSAVGYSEPIDCGKFIGQLTDQSRSVLCYAGQFLSLQLGDIHRGPKSLVKRARQQFAEKYRRNTAAWIDMNCQISSELNRATENIVRWLWPFKQRIPVVFSFLAARDDYDRDETRIGRVIELVSRENKYRTFVVHDVWKHQTASSPYLSVAGTFDGQTTKVESRHKHRHFRNLSRQQLAY